MGGEGSSIEKTSREVIDLNSNGEYETRKFSGDLTSEDLSQLQRTLEGNEKYLSELERVINEVKSNNARYDYINYYGAFQTFISNERLDDYDSRFKAIITNDETKLGDIKKLFTDMLQEVADKLRISTASYKEFLS